MKKSRASIALAVVILCASPVKSAQAFYNPAAGRWLNRDPIDEAGELNLYCLVGNAPVGRIDQLGLYPGEDHLKMDNKALEAIKDNLATTWTCRANIQDKVNRSNLGQDGWRFGGPLWDNRRHYNRDVGQTGPQGETAYQGYLLAEKIEFQVRMRDGSKDGCKLALKALGRLAHSWQDFFIHAIRRDGKGGKENSAFPGWTAFSVGIMGTPDNTSKFYPSSFKATGGGEHPGWGSEPVLTTSAEWAPRFNAAQSYTTDQLKSMLLQWMKPCRCHCESSFWLF